ncbi:MAG: ABC transporter ATP-binding protein [Patescibacteria group bacterium]|jgi:ABC-2 type transport system ATP-binding protein
MKTIEISSLRKYFGNTKAIDDISLDVDQGQIFGFLGPNGAGKTTTIRAMLSFIRPTSGMIKIFGKDTRKESVEIIKKIGYLSGNVRLYEKWDGQTHINFVKNLNGENDRSSELMNVLDFDASIKVKQLSSGNKQKLAIILALMTRPDLLIMDEPTNALDPLLQNEVYELLEKEAKNGVTIFMSSHNLSEVDKICDRVAIIKKGKIVATESILSLKEKKLTHVHIYFSGSFNKDEFIDENNELVKETSNYIVINVKGDINPLIKKISKYNIKDLSISQAALEDIFLEFYE